MEVVLFQPQIPPNTGNIVRTCKATRSRLTLVRPLGFSATDRMLRRAGLDYWDGVDVQQIDDLALYLEEQKGRPLYFFSSKVDRPYTEAVYEKEGILIFGSETTGLPPYFFENFGDRFYTIPMVEGTRSLNLSNSVAIVLYEGYRQLTAGFASKL